MFNLFGVLARFAQGLGVGHDRLLRSTAWLALLASVATGLANTVLLAVINRRLAAGGEALPSLWIAFAALCLLLPLSRFASQALLVRLGQGSVLGLRLHLSGRLLAAPLRRLEEIGSARLLTALTEDVGSIAGAVTDLPLLAMHATILVSCFVYLGYLSWLALVALLVSLVLGVLSYQVLLGRASRHFRVQRQAHEKLIGQFSALVEGNKELKLNRARRDAFVDELLRPTLGQSRRAQNAGEGLFAGILVWGRSLFFVIVGLIVFGLPALGWGDRQVITGFALVLLFMIIPLETVLALLPDMGRAWVALQRIEQLGFPLADDGSAAPEAVAQAALPWSRLELSGVRYSYGGEPDSPGFGLGPIDLGFDPGGVVFLIGGNGSGKTTLGKLLAGLYAPDAGEIRLGGRAIGEEDRALYRQSFAAVFSDFHLIEELLGLDEAALDERAGKYLERFALAGKVAVKDGRFSTIELSRGQRKRLALVLAYLDDRPAYLFDEWAADQDHDFKRVFYRELLPELRARGKTVFVITHDDHYFEGADRIVKLDSGTVVFDGSPGQYRHAGLAAWSQVPSAEPEKVALQGEAK